MKKIKIAFVFICICAIFMLFVGCSSSGSQANSMFGKYKIFNDADLALFEQDTFTVSLNRGILRLGMSRKEVEKILNEQGEGFASEGWSFDGSVFRSTTTTEVISYEDYKSLYNYYYYPNNQVAIIYCDTKDGKETNSTVVYIGVRNSEYIDKNGLTPQKDTMDGVKLIIGEKYGEENSELGSSETIVYFDGNGNAMSVDDYVTSPDEPGVWIAYYSYDGKEIDVISVGCRKSFSGDSALKDHWKELEGR